VPDIAIPKLNTIDTSYVLVEWLFAEGDEVPDDAAVAVVETSKAAEELVSDVGGILHRLVEPPADCPAGTVIGRLFADRAQRSAALRGEPAEAAATPAAGAATAPADAEAPPAPSAQFIVTAPARELMARHGLGEDDLRALAKKIVRSADIEDLLDRRGPAVPADPAGRRLSRSQLAVAEAVTLAHRTIPAAYCVAKVEADTALAYLDGVSRACGHTVGLPELLVKSIASAHGDFPLFFARLGEDGVAVPADAPRVGITVDVGTGLSVPVIADADRAPLPSLASALAELRGRALRGRLREADLAGANISLALNDDESIVAALPIIQPGQVGMLTFCSIQSELRLDTRGAPFAARFFHLGLAYDHRLLNGREAALFLRAVKASVEAPARLESGGDAAVQS